MNHRVFFDIMSGRLQTPTASLLRGGAYVASLGYCSLVRLRRRMYELGVIGSKPAGVPVISIGNITTGGTGKTPMVALVVEMLRERGRRPGILTRGYRRGDGSADEPELLRRLCQVPVVVNPDRLAGARQAVGQGCDVLVMDDGFQHLRLRRDLDIVLIDATNPFGYGHCLPRGLLREPPSVLSKAAVVVITRSDCIPAGELSALERKLAQLSGGKPICQAIHRPRFLSNGHGDELPLNELSGKKICAFCGIGNPDSFFDTLQRSGAHVVEKVAFEDHASYTPATLEHILSAATNWQADVIVTTAKDRVKLDPTLFRRPLWTLEVRMEITRGAELLDGAIAKALTPRPVG